MSDYYYNIRPDDRPKLLIPLATYRSASYVTGLLAAWQFAAVEAAL